MATDNYIKTADSDWYKSRLIGTMFCVILAFAVLTWRLFYLQILEGDEYRRLSENNYIRLHDIPSSRGVIFDRNGELLVDNSPAFDLYINLKDAAPLDETLEKLSLYTEIPKDEFRANIKNNKKKVLSYKAILLKENIHRDTLANVEVHLFDLPGISVNVRSVRNYMFKESGSHLIGYLGEISSAELASRKDSGYRSGDLTGKFGIEKAAESYLRGNRGGRQVEVNSSGQVIRVLETVDANPGHNIYLTIDYALQKKAEELIEEMPASIVAMNPENGEILAMASSPSFDPNKFVGGISHENWNELMSNPFRSMENKVIQGEYPPASTYKIVTAVAGLEEGVINKNTTFYCPGHYKYGDRIFRCWRKGGHGHVNVVKALAGSCDVFFYQVGQKLGVDRLAKYAKAFGLGACSGISLDHEARGLIPTAAWKKERLGIDWMSGENLSIAIGQGYNLTTPLQMVILTTAVANGGIRYKPLLIKEVKTIENEPLSPYQEKELNLFSKDHSGAKLPVSRNTLELVKKGLWEVVNGKGTARRAYLEGCEVAGKTGTAQVVGRKVNPNHGMNIREKDLPDHLKPHAWFVAYAPADKPKIAVAVMVENGEHGSGTTAPIAKEIIKFYLKSDSSAAPSEPEKVPLKRKKKERKIKSEGLLE